MPALWGKKLGTARPLSKTLDLSSKEDISVVMTIRNPKLLSDIDRFLEISGLSESYLGKASVGNSEVVGRLRRGGRVWPETELEIRAFIKSRMESLKEGSCK